MAAHKKCRRRGCTNKFAAKLPHQQYCCAHCRYLEMLRRRKRSGYQRKRLKSEQGRKWHATYMRKYYARPDRRLKLLAGGALRRAAKEGLPFDKDLAQHLVAQPPKNCRCCGIELDYSTGNGNTRRRRSPSLDRLVPSHGYTKMNVRVLCHRCNVLKSDSSLEELLRVVEYIRNEQA